VALPPISPSAPAPNAATTRPCTSVLQYLPQRLDGMAPRVVHPQPDSPFVVAWGEPAIVFRCGVDRPAELAPQSSEQIFSANGAGGPYWLPVREATQTVWTVIDRAVYIELTVPNSYQQPPLAPIGTAVAKGLPEAVCLPQAAVGQTPPDAARLCTHRR
jgi:hypothetical protein